MIPEPLWIGGMNEGLAQDHELSRLYKVADLHSVEVDTARELAAIEFHVVGACFLLSLNEGDNLLSESVVDCQEYLRLVRQIVAYRRAWVKGIWVVLSKREDF
jgi:uncharacterized protein YbgA (DUF1722 family)